MFVNKFFVFFKIILGGVVVLIGRIFILFIVGVLYVEI